MMTLALTLCAGAAMADHIGVYSDADGNSCALLTLVPFPSTNAFYVIHKFNPGSTASQFKIQDTTGLLHASASSPFLSIGDFYTDMSLAYGGCLQGQVLLGTLNFYLLGPQPTCSQNLEVIPAPGSPVPGAIAIVDCNLPSGNLKTATGGRAFAGPGSDQCPAGCNEPLATSEATWGSIKALYR
jgi:hypothetical protein